MQGKLGFAAVLIVATVASFWVGRESAPVEPEGASPVAPVEAPDTSAALAPEAVSAEPRNPGEGSDEAVADGDTVPTSIAEVMALEDSFGRVVAVHRLLEAADKAAVRKHFEALHAFPESPARERVGDVLVRRLAILDPAGARGVIDEAGGPERNRRIALLYRTWGEIDETAAIARVEALPPGADRMLAQAGLMGALAYEPARMNQLMMAMWAPGRALQVPADLVTRARQDPLGALGEALAIASPAQRQVALAQVAMVWSETAPLEALANSDLATNPGDRKNFRQTVLMQFAQRSPERALAIVDELEEKRERSMVFGVALGSIAQADVNRALALAEAIEERPVRIEALQAVFNSWGNRDPAAAAEALLLLDDPTLARRFAQNLIWSYSRLEPRGALAFAEKLDGAYGQLWQGAFSAFARNHPADALDMITDMKPSPRRAELLVSALGAMAANDPQLAADEALGLPRGPMRDQALQHVVQTWMNRAPEGALEWLVAQTPRDQTEMTRTAGHLLARTDLELAVATTQRLAAAAREGWISSILNQYLAVDPAEAAAFVLRYPDHDSFGQWVGQVAARLIDIDPESALDLVEAIEDDEQRGAARYQLMHAWSRVDPASAAEWLTDLPVEESTEQLFATVAAQWLTADPAPAAAWARTVVAPEHRDAALGAIGGSEYADDDTAAAALNDMRSDEKRRDALQRRVLSFARFEPVRARAMLDAVPLSDEHYATIEAQLEAFETD